MPSDDFGYSFRNHFVSYRLPRSTKSCIIHCILYTQTTRMRQSETGQTHLLSTTTIITTTIVGPILESIFIRAVIILTVSTIPIIDLNRHSRPCRPSCYQASYHQVTSGQYHTLIACVALTPPPTPIAAAPPAPIPCLRCCIIPC